MTEVRCGEGLPYLWVCACSGVAGMHVYQRMHLHHTARTTPLPHLLDHNNRHAADVLHATFYLLTEPIPEFDHQFHEDGSARIRWVGLENGRGWQLLVRNT